MDGTSSTYLEELQQRYQNDPKSVDKSWASFFHSLGGSLSCVWCLHGWGACVPPLYPRRLLYMAGGHSYSDSDKC